MTRPSRPAGGGSLRAARPQLPWAAVTVLVGVLVLLPLVPLQMRAFGNGAEGLRALTGHGTLEVFRTTLVLGVGAVVVGMLLGTTLALAVDAMAPRMRAIFGSLPLLPIVIPSVAHVVGFVFLFSPENGYVNTLLRETPFWSGTTGPINVYTPLWIVVYTGIHLAAFVYLFVYTGLQNLGADHALAARVNGAGPGRVLWTVTLPMLRPVFLYSAAVVFMLALGQFAAPLLLGKREGVEVVTTRMFEITQDFPPDYGLASALGTPLVVIALVLVLAQKGLLGNQDRFVGRGEMSAQAKPHSRIGGWVAGWYVGLFILLSAVLPTLALVFVALSPFWTGDLSLGDLTTRHVRNVLDDPVLTEAATTTVVVSLTAIALAIPLGMVIALALHDRRRLWRPLAATLDVLADLPLSLPAALVGFGFLFAFSRPWLELTGTRTGLTVAYLTLMLPYAVRYQLAALVALGGSTMEASRVAGAGPLRTFLFVVLPLSKRNIAAAAAVIFVLLTHEFGASLLLQGPDATVMSVVLFDKFTGGLYPEVAVAALIMTIITGIGVVAAMFFGGRKVMRGL